MKHIQSFLPPAALALLLSACGGGRDEQPAAMAVDPLNEVPASASQSSAALTSYVGTLATQPADSREPVSLDTFDPRKPDDSEPEPVG